ncbi:MAG: hypothetical protein GY828_05305 [Candidatus Gracilibacteria bacterium]|nr:hypothetical protein [Candidatus Gracilibacteria bacterium]
MKIKSIAVALSMALSFSTFAGTTDYNSVYAKNYALAQAKVTGYDSPSKWNYWFKDWTSQGGNCTNFANQAIRAGLAETTSPKTIFNLNSTYNGDGSWYYTHSYQSSAWKGAQEFFDYANAQTGGMTGMNFTFQTSDSPTTGLSFSKVAIGDIIFVDWENDGDIDHTMIVTGGTTRGYSSTYVSYHSSSNTTPKKNKSLSSLNTQFNYNNIFYVYRPTSYVD